MLAQTSVVVDLDNDAVSFTGGHTVHTPCRAQAVALVLLARAHDVVTQSTETRGPEVTLKRIYLLGEYQV